MTMMVSPARFLTNRSSLTLVNPGFETGDATGWSMLYGGNVSVTSSTSVAGPRTGTYSGRTGTTQFARWGQNVALPASEYENIDAGLMQITGSVWASGGALDDDVAGLTIAYLNEAGTVISEVWSNALTSSSTAVYTNQTLTIPLVSGARSVRIGVRGIRYAGATNIDMYFDDFDLYMTVSGKISTLLGYSVGDSITNWVNITGTLSSRTAADSTFGRQALIWSAAAGESYIPFTIPSNRFADVDSGSSTIMHSAVLTTWSDDTDTGGLYLEFYDTNNTLIGTRNNVVPAANHPSYGTQMLNSVSVPVGTRTVRAGYVGTRINGTELSSYLSNLCVVLQTPKP